jgi:hypothetical protein
MPPSSSRAAPRQRGGPQRCHSLRGVPPSYCASFSSLDRSIDMIVRPQTAVRTSLSLSVGGHQLVPRSLLCDLVLAFRGDWSHVKNFSHAALAVVRRVVCRATLQRCGGLNQPAGAATSHTRTSHTRQRQRPACQPATTGPGPSARCRTCLLIRRCDAGEREVRKALSGRSVVGCTSAASACRASRAAPSLGISL